MCPKFIFHRKIKSYEKARGYIYPGGHNGSEACRIYLGGLGNVYTSDGGAEFVIDSCEHVALVVAL